MNHLSLSDRVKVTMDINAQIASANINGTAIDMQGWSGCLFVFDIGTMANGATFDARVVSSANANMSGATNVTNAALVQVTNGGNVNTYMIDVWRPTDRYLRTATQPATANSTFSAVAIQYGRNGLNPPTQTAAQVVKVQAN